MSNANQVAQALIAALADSQAAFLARNAFSLSQSSLGSDIPPEGVLKQFAPLIPESELQELEEYFNARARAKTIVAGMASRVGDAAYNSGVDFLATCAKPCGNSVYEVFDESTHRLVRLKIVRVDSCYQTKDGAVAGSILVSPQERCFETLVFHLKEGRMVVRTEADLY